MDPKQTEGCQFGDQDCWVEGNKCANMDCVYCVTCNGCKEILDPEIKEVLSIPGGVKSSNYIGMCMVSLHNRQLTHRTEHKAHNKSNAMVKHEIDKHDGQIQNYTCRMVTVEKGLLHLSLREAILINGQINGTSKMTDWRKVKAQALLG